jgi:hypothetical protein
VRRGRRSGAFDRDVPARWIAAAFLGLMHAAAGEVAAGRMDGRRAAHALQRTVPRVFGVPAAPGGTGTDATAVPPATIPRRRARQGRPVYDE